MKRKGTKLGIVFFLLAVALVGIGGAFAHWSESITIEETVNTGTIDWEAANTTVSLDCQDTCGQTAWAFCDTAEPSCFQCPKNWGRYFQYQIGAGAMSLPLVAGQTYLVGTVTVATDGDDLEVTYIVDDPDWEMTVSHLYVDTAEPDKCNPGKFHYTSDTDNKPPTDSDYDKYISETVHTYTIPLSVIGAGIGDTVYVGAHAVVVTACPGGSGTVTVTELGEDLLIDVSCPQGVGQGTFCFEIHNSGTIPIIITEVSYIVEPDEDPPGVQCTLTTTSVIGTQLHGGESILCCFDIVVTGQETYTLTVTVEAVQWTYY